MKIEIDVLRALLRLACRRTPPTFEQIAVCVGGEEAEVRRALASLDEGGFVQRTTAGLRLSLSGLAVAVACARKPRARRAHAATGVRAEPVMFRTVESERSVRRAVAA